MRYLPKNTLAYFLAAPQLQLQNFSQVSMAAVASTTLPYLIEYEQDSPVPDARAQTFYCLNQLVAVLRKKFTLNEPLPDWAVDVLGAYQGAVVQDSTRLFYYLMLICTREARHAVNKYSSKFFEEFKEHGEGLKKFLTHLGPDAKTGAAMDFAKNELPVPIGVYADALVKCFNKLSWGGGYGGKPWGKIAATARDFLYGKITAEMMIDTAWTLAHNNGPMFNKGMLYKDYTKKIKNLLDVQRSGQVAESVIDKLQMLYEPNHQLQQLVGLVKAQYPEEIGDYVDWYKVEEAGALEYCGSYKQKQTEMLAAPPMLGGKPAKHAGEFWVTPSQKVQVIERIEV